MQPFPVVWFRKTLGNSLPEELNPEVFPQTQTNPSDGLIVSVLSIVNATEEDGGKYSCIPDDWEVATVTLGVRV